MKVDELVERIREYLADGEWHPSIQPQLRAEKFSEGTIQAARGRVARARKQAGSMDGGWEWRLHSSNTAETSRLRERNPRARDASQNPETSRDRDVNPITTELTKSQSSLTNNQYTNLWCNDLSKSQDPRENSHARVSEDDDPPANSEFVDEVIRRYGKPAAS